MNDRAALREHDIVRFSSIDRQFISSPLVLPFPGLIHGHAAITWYWWKGGR